MHNPIWYQRKMPLLACLTYEKTGGQRSNFLRIMWLVSSRTRFELKKLDLVTYLLNIKLFWNHIFASSEWSYSWICLTVGKPFTNSVCPTWKGALLIIVNEEARQTKASLWPLAYVSKTVKVENTVNHLLALKIKHVTCNHISLAKSSHMTTHNSKKIGKDSPPMTQKAES